MASEEKLIRQAIVIFKDRGIEALELAKQSVQQEKMEFNPLQDALRYFMERWNDVLHPALLSLACEAVGGNPKSTIQVGAAMVLLAGGADIHDDIIDQSTTKGGKSTVYGKFGKDIAILAGDVLLFQGLYVLQKACESLPPEKRQAILDAMKQAYFEITNAEAQEASLRTNFNLSGQEFLKIIKHKVSAGAAATTIGAILGGGTQTEIAALANYGRTTGTLMTIRDEFVDMFEPDELENRAKYECLPLPILLAFKDPDKKKQILKLLEGELTEDQIEKILDLTLGSKEVCDLKEYMKRTIQKEKQRISVLKNCKETLELILLSSLEEL
jgi:geranylgeranyl pyrophosphate synthase